MNIQITSRHVPVTDAIREYINKSLAPLLSEYPAIEHIHAVLSVEKYRHIGEILVKGKQYLNSEAKAETDDMYKSIDAATDKISKQLRRARDKVVSRKTDVDRERLADREASSMS